MVVILSEAKNLAWIETKRDSSRNIGAQNDKFTFLTIP